MNFKIITQNNLKQISAPSNHKYHFPALRFTSFTNHYDFILWISGLGRNFKKHISLMVQPLQAPDTIIDIGCGTGTQLQVLSELYPSARIIGIDPDKTILQKAEKRLRNQFPSIELTHATAESIPHKDETFDLCFSTLTFHHLTTEEKKHAFAEAYRLLKPGGAFVLTDWGSLRVYPFRWLLIFEDQRRLEDHVRGRIPQFATSAGFILKKATRVKPTGIWTWEFTK